jgi:hypothetical protein
VAAGCSHAGTCLAHTALPGPPLSAAMQGCRTQLCLITDSMPMCVERLVVGAPAWGGPPPPPPPAPRSALVPPPFRPNSYICVLPFHLLPTFENSCACRPHAARSKTKRPAPTKFLLQKERVNETEKTRRGAVCRSLHKGCLSLSPSFKKRPSALRRARAISLAIGIDLFGPEKPRQRRHVVLVSGLLPARRQR